MFIFPINVFFFVRLTNPYERTYTKKSQAQEQETQLSLVRLSQKNQNAYKKSRIYKTDSSHNKCDVCVLLRARSALSIYFLKKRRIDRAEHNKQNYTFMIEPLFLRENYFGATFS